MLPIILCAARITVNRCASLGDVDSIEGIIKEMEEEGESYTDQHPKAEFALMKLEILANHSFYFFDCRNL